MKPIIWITTCISALLFSCANDEGDLFDGNAERTPAQITAPSRFADPNINPSTRDLYNKLIVSTQNGIAFGQQVPFGTGNNFPVENALNNDFFEVAGDHPAIAGFDLELIGLRSRVDAENSLSLDSFIDSFVTDVVEAHNNGSIITMSWHMVNPNRSGNGGNGDGSFNNVVPRMLEGGDLRDAYLAQLARAAKLFNSLVDAQGNSIPVVFRPWHEMNGDFFFWGEGFRTTEAYIQLWRDTVRLLSEDFNVHNLLYVYAPNWVSNSTEYLRNYPGDAFVDMLGVDVYDFRNRNFLNSALNNLRIVEDIAAEKNMLFALTETGLENVVENTWWTQSLYRAIRSSGISYTMVWRNDSSTFFHAPFVGHPSVTDFSAFLDNNIILLSRDLQ
jgi:mannan endo-1,4-beta-mannosidase